LDILTTFVTYLNHVRKTGEQQKVINALNNDKIIHFTGTIESQAKAVERMILQITAEK